MAEPLDTEPLEPRDVDINSLLTLDLIGFGSGIYFGRHHRTLLAFVDGLPFVAGKKAFIFSTSGARNGIVQLPWCNYNRALSRKLDEKGFETIGEFSCRGLDTSGPWRLLGGFGRGRPSTGDLQDARNFATGLARACSRPTTT
jgi:flavodoxin